mgnify:CR=1 FL=1
MNESQIALLFGLFAGSDVDTGKYQSLLELAVTEVRQALRELSLIHISEPTRH